MLEGGRHWAATCIDDDPYARLMTVGVVVPAYNAERFLAATLRSIASQAHADLACVVVDDGSTDDTASVAEARARADPRFHVVRQSNAGLSAARNRGMRELGDVEAVSFMDADDLWHEAAVERLLTALRGCPGAVASFCLAETIDQQDDVLLPGDLPAFQRKRYRLNGLRLEALRSHELVDFAGFVAYSAVFPPNCVLVRRTALDAVGGFHPEFKHVQDWYMWLRLAAHGPFIPVDDVLVGYRRHPENLSSSTAELHAEVRRLRFALPRDRSLPLRCRALAAAAIARVGAEAVRRRARASVHADR